MFKFLKQFTLFCILLIGLLSLKSLKTSASELYPITLQYNVHVENIGWQGWRVNDSMAGTTGQALRIEAIQIKMPNPPSGLRVRYRAHVQDIGWQNWVYDGAIAGTTGQSKRIEAIEVELVGAGASTQYSIRYQTHVQDIGWQGSVSDGETSGTTGQSKRVEAFRASISSWNYMNIYSYQTSQKLIKSTKAALVGAIVGFLPGGQITAAKLAGTTASAVLGNYFVNSDSANVYYDVKYYYRVLGDGWYDMSGNYYGNYEIRKVTKSFADSRRSVLLAKEEYIGKSTTIVPGF